MRWSVGEEEEVRKKERRVRRPRIFIQPPEMVDWPKSGDLHNKYMFLHSKRSIKTTT